VFAVGAFLMAGSEMYRMGLEEKCAARGDGGEWHAAYRLEESVEADARDVVVMDALTSRVLPSQAISKGVLFQSDLAPGEKRRFLLFPRKALPVLPPVVSRAHARFVPERMDDFAWENDRIAHRVRPGDHDGSARDAGVERRGCVVQVRAQAGAGQVVQGRRLSCGEGRGP
jgi:hypothetical protein